jgi:hypothetical protein
MRAGVKYVGSSLQDVVHPAGRGMCHAVSSPSYTVDLVQLRDPITGKKASTQIAEGKARHHTA